MPRSRSLQDLIAKQAAATGQGALAASTVTDSLLAPADQTRRKGDPLGIQETVTEFPITGTKAGLERVKLDKADAITRGEEFGLGDRAQSFLGGAFDDLQESLLSGPKSLVEGAQGLVEGAKDLFLGPELGPAVPAGLDTSIPALSNAVPIGAEAASAIAPAVGEQVASKGAEVAGQVAAEVGGKVAAEAGSQAVAEAAGGAVGGAALEGIPVVGAVLKGVFDLKSIGDDQERTRAAILSQDAEQIAKARNAKGQNIIKKLIGIA